MPFLGSDAPAIDDGWAPIVRDCVQVRMRPHGLCCRDCLHRSPLRWLGLTFMRWQADETVTRPRAECQNVRDRPVRLAD